MDRITKDGLKPDRYIVMGLACREWVARRLQSQSETAQVCAWISVSTVSAQRLSGRGKEYAAAGAVIKNAQQA